MFGIFLLLTLIFFWVKISLLKNFIISNMTHHPWFTNPKNYDILILTTFKSLSNLFSKLDYKGKGSSLKELMTRVKRKKTSRKGRVDWWYKMLRKRKDRVFRFGNRVFRFITEFGSSPRGKVLRLYGRHQYNRPTKNNILFFSYCASNLNKHQKKAYPKRPNGWYGVCILSDIVVSIQMYSLRPKLLVPLGCPKMLILFLKTYQNMSNFQFYP